MNLETSTIPVTATLGAVVTRADGTTQTIDNLSTAELNKTSCYDKIRKALGPLGFFWQDTQGLVTNGGVAYLAADFLSGSSNHIAAFNYIDCGTGTTAAAVTDTALQTPAGTARVAGTQSNPTAGTYKTVGSAITFASSLAITEFGLFSASTAGTLWDHRVFAPINVNSGDSITFTYSCQFPSGGA